MVYVHAVNNSTLWTSAKGHQNITFTFTAGNYTVMLWATDAEGNTGKSQMDLIVKNRNLQPVTHPDGPANRPTHHKQREQGIL